MRKSAPSSAAGHPPLQPHVQTWLSAPSLRRGCPSPAGPPGAGGASQAKRSARSKPSTFARHKVRLEQSLESGCSAAFQLLPEQLLHLHWRQGVALDVSRLDAPLVQPRIAIFTASSPADYNICPHTSSIVQQYQQKFTDRRNIFLPEYSKLEADTSSSKHSPAGAKPSLLSAEGQKKSWPGVPRDSCSFHNKLP